MAIVVESITTNYESRIESDTCLILMFQTAIIMTSTNKHKQQIKSYFENY